MRFHWSRALLGFLFITSISAMGMPHFSAAEFPNLFMGATKSGSTEQKVVEAQSLLEQALGSVFHRLEVPIVSGSGELAMTRYFQSLHQTVRQIDPNVDILPSGGLVRSGIGYIYASMFDAVRKRNLTPREALLEIINSTQPVPAYEIRGLGSDFDVLITNFDPKNISRLKSLTLEMTNSAETHFQGRNIRGDFKRSLFTIGDVKDYSEQISRSTAQGGADIDFLAFNVQEKKFVLPPGNENIVTNLVKGYYQYLAPSRNEAVEDSDKQTVRGLRALVELPFLSLADTIRFVSEIEKLKDKLKSGGKLSAKAVDQFGKTMRNARFSGGHNRLFRGEQGSLESRILEFLLLAEEKMKIDTVPEFVDEFDLGRPVREAIPKELLIPLDIFISRYTRDGTLYHGTPSMNSGMAIMRGGFIVSGGFKKQGTFVKGRGAYSSPNELTALGYTRGTGMTVPLTIKRDNRIVVVDGHNQDHPFFQKIRNEFPGRDLHETLAREYGVDIVVNGHVLLQNIEAVDYPRELTMIVNLQHQMLTRLLAGRSIYNAAKAAEEYLNIYEFAGALGLKGLEPIPSLAPLFATASSSSVLALPNILRVYEKARISAPASLPANPQLKQFTLENLRLAVDDKSFDPSKSKWSAESHLQKITKLIRLANELGIQDPVLGEVKGLFLKYTQWLVGDFFQKRPSNKFTLERMVMEIVKSLELAMPGSEFDFDKVWIKKNLETFNPKVHAYLDEMISNGVQPIWSRTAEFLETKILVPENKRSVILGTLELFSYRREMNEKRRVAGLPPLGDTTSAGVFKLVTEHRGTLKDIDLIDLLFSVKTKLSQDFADISTQLTNLWLIEQFANQRSLHSYLRILDELKRAEALVMFNLKGPFFLGPIYSLLNSIEMKIVNTFMGNESIEEKWQSVDGIFNESQKLIDALKSRGLLKNYHRNAAVDRALTLTYFGLMAREAAYKPDYKRQRWLNTLFELLRNRVSEMYRADVEAIYVYYLTGWGQWAPNLSQTLGPLRDFHPDIKAYLGAFVDGLPRNRSGSIDGFENRNLGYLYTGMTTRENFKPAKFDFLKRIAELDREAFPKNMKEIQTSCAQDLSEKQAN